MTWNQGYLDLDVFDNSGDGNGYEYEEVTDVLFGMHIDIALNCFVEACYPGPGLLGVQVAGPSCGMVGSGASRLR